jgi:hypothetical protein
MPASSATWDLWNGGAQQPAKEEEEEDEFAKLWPQTPANPKGTKDEALGPQASVDSYW